MDWALRRHPSAATCGQDICQVPATPRPDLQEKILKGPIKIGGLTIEESGVIQKPSGAITEMKESMSVRAGAQ